MFNLGDYRRNVEDHYHDHSYFDPNNEKAAQMREQEIFLFNFLKLVIYNYSGDPNTGLDCPMALRYLNGDVNTGQFLVQNTNHHSNIVNMGR